MRLSQTYDTAINVLPIHPRAVIMDHGCGGGKSRSLRLLSRPDIDLIGVDRSEASIHEAQRIYPKVRFLQMTGGHVLRLDNEVVDGVFSGFCLNEAPTVQVLQETAREIHRVLRPGGRLSILTLNPDGVDVEFPGHRTFAPSGKWLGAPLISIESRTGNIHVDFLWDEDLYIGILGRAGLTDLEVNKPIEASVGVSPFLIISCQRPF